MREQVATNSTAIMEWEAAVEPTTLRQPLLVAIHQTGNMVGTVRNTASDVHKRSTKANTQSHSSHAITPEDAVDALGEMKIDENIDGGMPRGQNEDIKVESDSQEKGLMTGKRKYLQESGPYNRKKHKSYIFAGTGKIWTAFVVLVRRETLEGRLLV